MAAASAAALILAGCGVGPAAAPSSASPVTGTLAMQGKVHGGQPPVAFSTIQLYVAGATGYGSASRLLATTLTDAGGNFSLNNLYACTNATDQLYVVAHAGNPGLATGTSNSSLTMMAALGNCSAAPSIPFIFINEVTTVAAAWTLAPFAGTDYAHIGTSSTNASGLANAILNAQQIVDISTGQSDAVPANITTEAAKIYSLANSLAPCVNSTGNGCAPLFAAAQPVNGSLPTDTWQAAVDIVRNPAHNVAAVYNVGSGFAQFVGLSAAPNDWTLTETIAANGLSTPTAAAVDKVGNVMVTNYNGPLSAFTPQGTPLGVGTYATSNIQQSFGIAIDERDQIWISNTQLQSHGNTQGSILVVSGAHNATYALGTIQGYGYNNSVDFPVAVAADGVASLYIANNGNSSATVWKDVSTATWTYTDANGNSANTMSIGSGTISFPVAIAPDTNASTSFPGSFWVANYGTTTISHFDAKNNVLANVHCCNGPNGLTTDSAGNAWTASYFDDTVAIVNPNGTFQSLGGDTCTSPCNAGVHYPANMATDGDQNIWVANYRGASISKLAGISATDAGGNTLAPGTPLSPDSTYDSNGNTVKQGGFGNDVSLLLPYTVAPDASGNIWVPNEGNNTLVVFLGIAAPSSTPRYPLAKRP